MSFQINTEWHTLDGAELLMRTRDLLIKALFHEKKKGRTNQAKIAKILGVDRSVINKQLTGEADLGLTRVGEIASLLGRRVRLEISDNPLDDIGRNVREPEIHASTSDETTVAINAIVGGIRTSASAGSDSVEPAL